MAYSGRVTERRRLAVNRIRHHVAVGSTPLFAELVEAGLFQICRSHGRVELDVRLKGQEPRLGERGNLGSFGEVHHEHARALAAEFGEIGGLWFLGVHDFLEFRPGGAVLHGGVELLVWHGDDHQCFHNAPWFGCFPKRREVSRHGRETQALSSGLSELHENVPTITR